jgi:uncharacterized protein YndB with AHSA1/START domain
VEYMILSVPVEIKASPEKIYTWSTNFEENFKKWHPYNVTCTWIEGEPMKVGSVLYIEEHVHGSLHKIRFRLTKIEPNRRIEFTYLFPLSLATPDGSFIIEPEGDHCIFTATLSIRFGSLFSRLFPDRIEDIRVKMKEEEEFMKKILEKS